MAYNFNQPQQQQFFQPQNQQQQQQVMNQNIQPLFPQPQGNVYNINSTLEVANVPVGAGVSVALCMPENVMFIKTMQNGNPLFYPYKIVPFSNEVETSNTQATTEPEISIPDMAAQLKQCFEKITELEELVKTKKKGVDFAI